MKVLQKIARFVSVLIGILIHRYRKGPHWCKSCIHSRQMFNIDEEACVSCTACCKLGAHLSKPSNFKSMKKEDK